MPNIVGTNGANTIDVTDDNGTLDGTPQGTPIDDIRARNGNDTITVTDSTISEGVRGNGGADDITITDSTVSGFVNGGNGGDTVNIKGSDIGIIRLGGGNDVLNLIGTTVDGGINGGNGSDSLNLPVGSIITDDTFGTITVTASGSYSLSSGTVTLPSGTTVAYTAFEDGTGFPCFVQGTRIATGKGAIRVQRLQVGDMIPTKSNGPRKIRWIGRRRFDAEDLRRTPKLRPIRIMAGALGNGMPERDLLVSRQHRMLVQSRIAEHMFGAPEVLIPAIRLIKLPGIFIDEAAQSVEYFHLLFDRHEVIFAEGAPTESLYTGPEALRSISPDAREEILTIFPEVADQDYTPQPARLIPRRKQQKHLIARHLKNNKPLLRAARQGRA